MIEPTDEQIEAASKAMVENFVESGWDAACYIPWDKLGEKEKETARFLSRVGLRAALNIEE